MRLILLTFLLLSSFVFAKQELTVSILPQKFFVEKIVGDKMRVNVMVKPGSSPATYEPKTSQMKLLSKSQIYFSIGVPFEKAWLNRFKNSNKDMLIADTSKGIKKVKMVAHHHEDEKEHDGMGHSNDEEHGLDPHIWLEPSLVKIQAKNIYDALVQVDKENIDYYKSNLDKFLKQLDSLDEKIKKVLKNYENKAFMVFHPSWGYFARRYHLEQISIEIEGKEPKPGQLVELVKKAKEHNIKIVFVSPQFSQSGAKTISNSINGTVSSIDPLSEKWDENLIKVANEIAKSYK